jgi:hypothetical protein
MNAEANVLSLRYSQRFPASQRWFSLVPTATGGWRKVQERRHHRADSLLRAAVGWSSEVELLFLCARWPLRREEDLQIIRDQCSRPLDWPLFLRLVQHHRLAPLVSFHLHACVPQPRSEEQWAVFAELRKLSAANTFQALRSLAELRRIVQAFEAEGVTSVRVLKGLPLAQSVFGDLSLRANGDLDLLIEETSILNADRVLRGLGYQGLFQVDHFSPKRLAFYGAHWKDVAYSHPDTGLEADLHWRCFRNSGMPGNPLCTGTGRDAVSFGEFRVATLPRMESLLYQCVHGTLDGWLYLKSLVDVGAQVRGMSDADLDALAALAIHYGVLPELTAALVLVRRYLGMSQWSTHLLPESDRTVAHILRYADRNLLKGNFLAGRDDIPIATTLRFEFGLRRSFRYRSELLLRVLFRARMWETLPLPDFLFWLYPLFSPVEWVVFRMRQRRQRPAAEQGLSG